MSRPFWIAAFAGGGLAALLIHLWADTRQDAWIILAVFLWTIFALAIIDVIRTWPKGPTLRNP